MNRTISNVGLNHWFKIQWLSYSYRESNQKTNELTHQIRAMADGMHAADSIPDRLYSPGPESLGAYRLERNNGLQLSRWYDLLGLADNRWLHTSTEDSDFSLFKRCVPCVKQVFWQCYFSIFSINWSLWKWIFMTNRTVYGVIFLEQSQMTDINIVVNKTVSFLVFIIVIIDHYMLPLSIVFSFYYA